MNKLDKQYQELLQSILDYGVEKKDRTGTGTKSIFGYTIRHNMRDGFPILTTKKMMDVFEQEKKELVGKVEKMYREYLDSVMVWESKISFDPVVGQTYYLYNFKGVNTLSLLSPDDWNKHDCFIGGFVLNSDRKWIRI